MWMAGGCQRFEAVVSDQWSVFRKREGELVLFDASAVKLRMNGARGTRQRIERV
jgi:hypothetical protein